MGQSLPNQEIFRRLARAMGLNQPELYEPDLAVLDTLVSQTGVAKNFAALAAHGTVEYSKDIVTPFAGNNFPTPSGKIEIASAQAEAAGAPRLPYAHADDHAAGAKLRILSPASPWTMNSAYGNDPGIRKKLGPATVALHPDDAAARHLHAGSMVTLHNDEDDITLQLTLDATLPRGVPLLEWLEHQRPLRWRPCRPRRQHLRPRRRSRNFPPSSWPGLTRPSTP
jgi:anaerobic selenocysteine-containing dehydrogenase